MKQRTETRDVPKAALVFGFGEFELGDNGEGAKTAPFRMVARSGRPVEHSFWGRVVHDFAGMTHKARIPIDYVHNAAEVIGYANKFAVNDDGDLAVAGALVPFKDSDRATEIIHKAAAGVPYEASIMFGGDGIKIQEIAEGELAEVNGYQFEGPGIVIREWPLRGVAVCPYGADQNTKTEFKDSEKITVNVTRMEKTEMAEQETVEVGADAPTVEAEPQTNEAPKADSPAVEGAPDEASAPTPAVETGTPAELADPRAEVKRYVDAFGSENGAKWFADGVEFADAMKLHADAQAAKIAELSAENVKLSERLKAAGSVAGADEPATFADGAPPARPKGLAGAIKIRK